MHSLHFSYVLIGLFYLCSAVHILWATVLSGFDVPVLVLPDKFLKTVKGGVEIPDQSLHVKSFLCGFHWSIVRKAL
jgi:hypothetical protein